MRDVLIIDDNPAVGEALSLLLTLRDVRAHVAAGPAKGLEVLATRPIDLVIQDMNFGADTTSGAEGIALFHAIRERQPDLPVILLTAWTRLESAVELVKAGAADYLAKPWDDARLLTTVENLLELSEASRAVATVRRERLARQAALARDHDLGGLVFASEAMARIVDLACQVARSDLPVLVTGPNGSGKERIAQIVHANSRVRAQPFIAVNCGALPSELIEAELFGVESGAFTGAHRPRAGRFEAADGGTLFLDEIGNLPLAGQVKLLRVLETGSFERLGSSRTQHVTVRVISATNADLRARVRTQEFREDLFYRLNVIELALPSLAERRDDVLPLAESFLKGRAVLTEAAREALLAHAWPGNVRELKNAIDRAVALCDGGAVTPALLALPSAPAAAGGRNLDEPTREAIVAALHRERGVVSRAASALGLSRQALYRRLERYGLAEGADTGRDP